jgi:hypothetical protein
LIGGFYQHEEDKFLVEQRTPAKELVLFALPLGGKEQFFKDYLMASPFFDLARIVNLDKSRVSNPRPTIFICGGQLLIDEVVAPTLRASLVNLLRRTEPVLTSRVLLAESAAAWERYEDHFQNLIDLEEHLAALSTMILLIAESPGSFAELGAFSFVPSMIRKLWVVNEESYDAKSSFIRQGPIAKLENASPPDKNRYFVYEWLTRDQEGKVHFAPALAETSSASILERVLRPAVLQAPQSETFDRTDIGHQMLLVADLVSVGGPLGITELIDLVNGCGLGWFDLKAARRYLYVLEKLDLVAVHRRGNYPFYVPHSSLPRILQYAQAGNRPFDRDGFTMELREVQRSTAASIHGDRAAIFNKFMRDGGLG